MTTKHYAQRRNTAERKARRGGRFLATPTGSSAAAFFIDNGFRISLSPVGRALLVAALLTSGFALFRYSRALRQQSPRVRWWLMLLRGMSLVLVAGALAGIVIEYDTVTRPRVLVVSQMSESKETAEATTATMGVKDAVIASLKRRGFEVIEGRDREAQLGFVAAAFVTDGAMEPSEARRAVEETSARLGGLPVYVLQSFQERSGPSVALEEVSVLGAALRGVPVAVRCMVHSRGLRGRESIITISDDAKVQASARIAWTGDDQRQAAVLTLVPKVSGWLDYSVKVEAASDETIASRSRSFTVNVEERKQRILFFEGEPTWESKFIRRALEQSGLFDVDYFAQVSRVASVGSSIDSSQTGNEDNIDKTAGEPGVKLHSVLRSPATLNLYDGVVVGASPNSLLSASESALLSAWVERRGGGLIVLGGNGFNGSVAARGGRLSPLLPAEAITQSSAEGAPQVGQGRPLEVESQRGKFSLASTEEGAAALAGYLNASDRTSQSLLTGQGMRLGALRPGATVLAVAGRPNDESTNENGEPLIAAMNYGAGRTLIFAPADSWRMRTSASGEEDRTGGQFNALWQGIVLWASARAKPAAELVLSDESPIEGSDVIVEIRVRDASFSPARIEKINAQLQAVGEDLETTPPSGSREVPFAPDPNDPSVWRARLHLNERGRLMLQADYVAAGKTGNVEKQFAVVGGGWREPGTSNDTLRRAARAAGGDFIGPSEIDAFLQRLSVPRTTGELVHNKWELRSWWPLAIFIPFLLSAEWFLRRWWRIE